MRVMINATGCPAPVSDRASMKTHACISHLIAVCALSLEQASGGSGVDLDTDLRFTSRC